jgi:PKD repeat protein
MKKTLVVLSLLGLAASCTSETATPDGTGGTGGGTGEGGEGSNSGGQTSEGSGGDSSDGSGGTVTPVEPAEVLPCFIDEGEPAGDAISLAVVANRVSGVAPLSVFFDTAGTTAEATDRPYHDLAYCWDFGDEDAGAFATTGLSKNQGRGPTVGHVYETPGTYSVTLSARDSQGRATSVSLEIEVEDPDEVFADTTTCVSAAGDFDDCPEGAEHITASSLGEAQEAVAPGHRILVHRGEEYTGGLGLNVQGPGLIGAYGPETEARPKITPSGTVFRVSGQEPDFSDWRIVDFDIEGNGNDGSGGVSISGKAFDLLILRMRAVGLGAPVEAPDSVLDYWNGNGNPGHDAIDGLTIADCELRDIIGGSGHNAAYVAAHRFLVLGTIFWNSTEGEHLLRTPWIDRGWITSSVFGESPAPRHLIKMHGPQYPNPDSIGYMKYTERVVVSDNLFDGVGGHDWSVSIAPKNGESDERLRDIIVERNRFLPGPTVQAAVALAATHVTVRENLFNSGPEATCVTAGTRGIEPDGERIEVYNNTAYTEGDSLVMASFRSEVLNSVAYNNLGISSTANGIEIRGAAEEAGNLFLSPDAITTDPPLEAADYVLAPGSEAIDAAEEGLWSPWDYEGRPAPIDGDDEGEAVADVGALEYEP